MKLTVFFGSFFVSLAVFAADPVLVQNAVKDIGFCQNFVRPDHDHVYLGYGYYSNSTGGFHTAQPTPLVVIELGKPKNKRVLQLQDSAIDLVSQGDRLYILTYTALEEWDKNSWTRVASYPTYLNVPSPAFEEHATQMALYQNQLVISQGRLGYSIFDLNSKSVVHQERFVQERLPLESKATGVAVLGDKAFFALDSFTLVPEKSEKPFQGIIVVDLKSRKVTDKLLGLEAGSDALFAYDNQLVVSFYGIPLVKYVASNLKGDKLPGPTHRISQYPEMGRLLGKPTLDGEYIYTCFQKIPDGDGEKIRRLPRVWKRQDLKLN